MGLPRSTSSRTSMPSEAYVFDLVRVGKGISVLDRRTGQLVYSIKFEKRSGLCFFARAGTTLHRAPINDKGALPDPYATIRGKSIDLVESPSRPTKRYAKKDFLKNARKGEYLVVCAGPKDTLPHCLRIT